MGGREETRTETEMENVPPEVTCVSEGGGIDEIVCLRVVEDGSERGVGVPDPGLYLQKGSVYEYSSYKEENVWITPAF